MLGGKKPLLNKQVKAVHNQKYLGKPNIYTGTRLVNIVLNSTLPRTALIGGHMCHVWYKGQPVVCNLCNDLGHKSATCPGKDKCRLCKQPGHFACNCLNPWGTTPEALLTGSGVTEIDGAVASVSAVDVMEGGGVDLVVTVEIGVADPSVSVSEESVETVAGPIDSDVGGFMEVENDGDDPAAGAFHDASDHEDPLQGSSQSILQESNVLSGNNVLNGTIIVPLLMVLKVELGLKRKWIL